MATYYNVEGDEWPEGWYAGVVKSVDLTREDGQPVYYVLCDEDNKHNDPETITKVDHDDCIKPEAEVMTQIIRNVTTSVENLIALPLNKQQREIAHALQRDEGAPPTTLYVQRGRGGNRYMGVSCAAGIGYKIELKYRKTKQSRLKYQTKETQTTKWMLSNKRICDTKDKFESEEEAAIYCTLHTFYCNKIEERRE